MNARGLLARLEDFRLLPVFVVVSMAIGIAVGNVLSISDFTLTPPIDALKAIAGGTFEPTVASVISLGVLAAGLGHYVQNALVAVRTFIDLAPSKLAEAPMHPDELRDPAFWKDFYQHVRGQVGRITNLLQALGQATERPPLHFDHEIRLADTLRSALQKAQPRLAEKSLTVENAVPDDLPALTVDRNLFGRLFDLLLEDEIINLPSGGRIRFGACPVTLPDGTAPGLQIQVEDNGPGLPENALRSVFDPFFLHNGNPNEFGINLMACYFIVYHHGGKIEASSREG